MTRTKIVPSLVCLMGLVVIVAIVGLQHRAATDRRAQLQLTTLRAELAQLQSAPLQSSAATAGSPELAAALMRSGRQRVTQMLVSLRKDSPVPALSGISRPLEANLAALDRIVALSSSGLTFDESAARAVPLLGTAAIQKRRVDDALGDAGDQYDQRASAADGRATAGSVAAILLLLFAFALLYGRSVRAHKTAVDAQLSAELLARENARLAKASAHEARTDALTGLRNRRALIDDLQEQALEGRAVVLALFDLDGFKQYNDTFGHPAGDALLTRLGNRLTEAVGGAGTAYRMGGDEFCVLAAASSTDAPVVRLAVAALAESGDAFEILCSHGAVMLPAEARSPAEALSLADQRMYANKASGRSSASQQSSDVLLKVLSERNAELREHLDGVGRLAALTAERLGLDEHEVKRITLAAELHDVGKTAIPDAILHKPGPLDEREWEFMRRHTLVGERILLAAPSLAPTADLVRHSHERFDGNGYPDGISGDEIPLGSSIIAVCDAYDAMVSERAYRREMPTADAIAELERCAGSQFDPTVVGAFCALVAELESAVPTV